MLDLLLVPTIPLDGLIPAIPQKAAGVLKEPAKSEPVASGTIPDATADAPPPVDAPAPVEPKSLEDMNKTELQVECSTRGLPTTGTKADLLARLTAGEAEGEAEVEPSPEGEGNGESDSE